MTNEERALALRVAEQLENEIGYNSIMEERGYPAGLGLSPEEARALASMLREAAEGGWRPIETEAKNAE